MAAAEWFVTKGDKTFGPFTSAQLKELASAEVDRTYISYIENDHKSPTLEMLAALGVRVSEVIRRAERAGGQA